jgi:hmuU protein
MFLQLGGEFSIKDIRDTMAKIASALERVDTLARTVAMAEIPVGIITSLVGAPFLIALLRSKAKELLK